MKPHYCTCCPYCILDHAVVVISLLYILLTYEVIAHNTRTLHYILCARLALTAFSFTFILIAWGTAAAVGVETVVSYHRGAAARYTATWLSQYERTVPLHILSLSTKSASLLICVIVDKFYKSVRRVVTPSEEALTWCNIYNITK